MAATLAVSIGVKTSLYKRGKILVFSINEKKTFEPLMEIAENNPNNLMIKNLQLDEKGEENGINSCF